MTPDKIKVSITNYYTEMFGGSRHFLMPKYQRPFSWEEKHIEDFWNDMVFAIEEAGNAGNKLIWEKADYYQQSAFKGTRELAEEIKRLKTLVDSTLPTVPDAEKQMIMHLPFKILFEIREMELLAFIFSDSHSIYKGG